jgi:hypothetical protein
MKKCTIHLTWTLYGQHRCEPSGTDSRCCAVLCCAMTGLCIRQQGTGCVELSAQKWVSIVAGAVRCCVQLDRGLVVVVSQVRKVQQ